MARAENDIEHCPRAKSEMTPCVRRDKYAADDDRYCVGCGLGADEVADELRDISRGAVEASAKVVVAWDAYLSDTDDEDDTTWCALRDAIDALRAGER